jgi:hypothetical protein
MKKMILSLALLLYVIAGFGQATKPVKIDSLVTVSLPAAFQKKDTLGQHIYSANAMYGYMTVIVAPNEKNNAPLKREKDLNGVLKTYIKNIQGQSADASASAENVRDTTVGTLKAKVFTLKSNDAGGNSQLINFILVYTTETTYTFEYVYPDSRADLVKDEYKAFSSSIRLSRELQRNDQYLSNSKGFPVVPVAAGAAVVIVVLIIVAVVRRRKRLYYS